MAKNVSKKIIVECDDHTCLFNMSKKCIKDKIKVTKDECKTYEKGICYYVNHIWNLINNSSIIPMNLIDKDTRIGLFYAMKFYNLSFSYYSRGGWEWLSLVDENKQPIMYKDIVDRELNYEAFTKYSNLFNQGILPDQLEENKTDESQKKIVLQPYGWLAPDGEFFEAEWGEHENKAYEFLTSNKKYIQIDEDGCYVYKPMKFLTYGDWAYSRGFVLIDNPTGDGSYSVSYRKELTKKQREFLYGYFIDMGNTLRAETFLKE